MRRTRFILPDYLDESAESERGVPIDDRKQSFRMLFLIGTGRCGSTMVQEALAHHPQIGWVSNVDAAVPLINSKGPWNRSLYGLTPRRLRRRDRIGARVIQARGHFGPSEAYRILERQVSPLLSVSFRDLTAKDVTPWIERRVAGFFEERARAQKKGVFLHKFTGWPRAAFLERIFPTAKFVHVIRDGRAVASSLLQMPWWRGYRGTAEWGFGSLGERYQRMWEESDCSFPALAGIEWMMMMDAFEVAKESIPGDHWMEIRYEDFVERPRDHVELILQFIGLDWTPEFEARFAAYPFTSSRKAGYLADLSAPDIETLNTIMADHLRRYGYEPGAAESVGKVLGQ